MDKIAALIPMQKTYLCRKYKKETGQTISEYLNAIRIEQAQRLIVEGKHPITEIALMVGYNSYSYFRTVFKSKTRVSCTDSAETSSSHG